MQFENKKLKDYTYIKTLGKGGFGKVVKIKDKTKRRTYALKLLHKESAIYLFKRENNILQQLNHSNIVHIYDASFEDNEEAYILMQYMKHGNVKNYLKNNKINLKDKLILVRDITHALSYAHKIEVIHRDIKPENILIHDEGEGPYACLGDFGVAKDMKQETTLNTAAMSGSPKYWPLEFFYGTKERNELTDLYALGMSMYEILTGRHPYNVKTDMDFYISIKNDTLTPPSHYNSTIPYEVDKMSLKVIAKAKEDRYESLEAFNKDLDKCIEKLPNCIIENSSQNIKDAHTVFLKNRNNNNKGNEHIAIEKELEKKDENLDQLNHYELASFYHRGNENYKKNYIEAVYYYEQAIQNGNIDALCNLGELYQEGGHGITQDYNEAIKWYTKAIESDNTLAMNYMGKMYENGHGVKKSYQEALKWYTKAAELYNNTAMNNIGDLYWYGFGVELNLDDAYYWYQKSAELGNIDATRRLGEMYEYGWGTKENTSKAIQLYERNANLGDSQSMCHLGNILCKNDFFLGTHYKEAIKWYKKAAVLGNTDAMKELGDMYRYQFGVRRNFTEVFKWYGKSAQGGNSSAMYELGIMHKYGHGVDINLPEAMKWYKKSATLGNTYALDELIYMYSIYDYEYELKDDHREMIKWLQKAAKLDNTNAQTLLGNIYQIGHGVEQDYKKAVEWYKKSARLGSSDAMNNLGYMHEVGYGVKQDYNEAIKWYKKSAELDNIYAMNNLGTMYRHGHGVKQDYNEAIKWYKSSAKSKHTKGMINLGEMYKYGYGVEANLAKAIKWYKKAAKLNDEEAMYKLGKIYLSRGTRLGEILFYLGIRNSFKPNYREAAKWYKKSAQLGNIQAMKDLGDMYKKGYGVERSEAKAYEWYKKAEDLLD